MTAYLSIGAVQIQSWITRTVSRLALLRGASIVLSERTNRNSVDAWLTANGSASRTADDAGDVDGVIVIELHPDEVTELPAELLQHLASRLPGVQWEAWVAEGDGYLEAFAQHAAGRDLARFQVLPPTPELGIVRGCGFCGAEPAMKQVQLGGDTEWAGADCSIRLDTWRKAQRTARAGKAEVATVQDWTSIPGMWPRDFETLAAKGGIPVGGDIQTAVGRKESRSHLALIAADGNGVGRLFETITNAHVGNLRRKAVAELTETTREAVVEAAKEFCANPVCKVLIPHYVGGDDVLLSVPAVAAWQVASALGRHFERLAWRLEQYLSDGELAPAGLRDVISGVGIGIGIVFMPRSHPVADAVPVAHRALAAAKALTKGGSSAIGWMDITHGTRNEDVHAIELSEVVADLGPGNRPDVFRLGPSARGSLAMIMQGRQDNLRGRIREWAKRTDNQANGWAEWSDVQLDALVSKLPALLSRARWWPNVSEDEEDR